MGTFPASLRATGDVKALPATIELSDGRLSIVAGSTEIGSWPLTEIDLEQIPTGYRMAAEGEQILLEIKDLDAFATELAKGTKKRSARRRKKEDRDPPPAKEIVVSTPPVDPLPATPATRVPHRESPMPAPTTPEKEKVGAGTKILASVDTLLIKAKERFGAYLPDFLFSRAMFAIAVVVLIVMILLPGVFSIVLIIAGVLGVLFGAVVYSDSVLASRYLPGRATPQHALLLGLSVLLFGVLLGILAK